MERVQFSLSKEATTSYSYLIEQKEDTYPYDNKFRFSHFHRDPELQKKFNGKTPIKLKKSREFLNEKKVLDISFFRTTPYIKVAKTFEEQDSWKQDVLIFMIDVDEIKNDSIVLREVTFTRPIKE
ncbi:hypothetical protein [Autumnicola psychrophila]|uniref:Uncharacterized protein n=1 Tax=Autumnicola psychrophila TaxID=3075592 RepID=A0ABU3DNZ6_9FLAO|nr:hypothetical protein [Zunongwangia sp. F225]MDT0685425.1 hypothetical protein [Zunongwangia sp. F225]